MAVANIVIILLQRYPGQPYDASGIISGTVAKKTTVPETGFSKLFPAQDNRENRNG